MFFYIDFHKYLRTSVFTQEVYLWPQFQQLQATSALAHTMTVRLIASCIVSKDMIITKTQFTHVQHGVNSESTAQKSIFCAAI
jgi:hypothetical protein